MYYFQLSIEMTEKCAVSSSLTSWKTVPDFQTVVSAKDTSRGCCVCFQLEALKLQNDFRHLWGKDHEGAVQVVGVFFREPRRLYDTAVGGEVLGALGTYGGG